MDVFFFEAFAEEQAALRRYLPEHIKAGFAWQTIQEYNCHDLPAPVVSVRTQSILPPEWAGALRGILTRSTGYDHIRKYCLANQNNASCGYLPLYCKRSVAEQAMLMWMALLRKLKKQTAQFYDFNRDGLTGQEAENKTLLVVGVGNIGGEIVKIGHGLGMRVLGVDLAQKYPGETYVNLKDGIGCADIIACAMNLTPENEGMFNYALLKKAPRGVIFVNVSRGEQSPSSDLLRLLREGHLGGVGLDVYAHEQELAVSLRARRSSTDPETAATLALVERDDVILTPHNAFNTSEAVERKSEQSVRQLLHLIEHGEFLWPMPS